MFTITIIFGVIFLYVHVNRILYTCACAGVSLSLSRLGSKRVFRFIMRFVGTIFAISVLSGW